VTDAGVAANRKKFRGTLEAGSEQGLWQIVWSDEPAPKPGQRVSKKRVLAPLKAMQFSLTEVREARLAPIVDFKGRKQPKEVPMDADVPAAAHTESDKAS
jgi:ribosome maturation factor RimP